MFDHQLHVLRPITLPPGARWAPAGRHRLLAHRCAADSWPRAARKPPATALRVVFGLGEQHPLDKIQALLTLGQRPFRANLTVYKHLCVGFQIQTPLKAHYFYSIAPRIPPCRIEGGADNRLWAC